MHFSINYRLLRNNCILFFSIFFIFEFTYITFLKTNDRSSSDINLDNLQSRTQEINNDNLLKKVFRHLQPHHYSVSCQNLFENDYDEFKHALALLSDSKNLPFIADQQYNITKEQCSIYRSERFNESYHREDSSSNRLFPLAFTILMYENIEQFERLLRLIYRPQNFYCIHVDSDASENVLKGVKSIAQCFDNIILASKQEKVLYATFSRLQAELNCMQDLMKFPSWKYLLNVANTELPLKTNSELVKILKIYRGYNDIEGRWKSKNKERTDFVWQVHETPQKDNQQRPQLRRTSEKKSPPPGNVEIVKGSAYGRIDYFYLNDF